MFFRLLCCALVTIWCSLAFGEEADEVARAIDSFRSGDFNQRETGRMRLLDLGIVAVPALAEAMSDEDPEVADRALSVLRQFTRGRNTELRDAAEERLLSAEAVLTPPIRTHWNEAVTAIRTRRKREAIFALERLGAEFSDRPRLIGPGGIVEAGESIEFGSNWRGSARDLKHLAAISDLKRVVFNKVSFGSEEAKGIEGVASLRALSIKRTTLETEALKKIVAMKSLVDLEVLYVPLDQTASEVLRDSGQLSSLRLFGNEFTAEQSQAILAALPQTKVDIRRGGFLGVGVQPHPLGAMVSNIQPESAAQRVGIEIGDILFDLGGDKVADFETLTAAIGKHRVGDEIEVSLFREGERRTVKARLGEWE